MKKIFTTCALFVLALSFAACGPAEEAKEEPMAKPVKPAVKDVEVGGTVEEEADPTVKDVEVGGVVEDGVAADEDAAIPKNVQTVNVDAQVTDE